VYGDGARYGTGCTSRDHCSGIDAALRHGAPGEAYNVAAGTSGTTLKSIHTLLDLLEPPRSLVQFVNGPARTRRSLLPRFRQAGYAGWTPSRSFDEALAETVAWYVEHEGWWRET
jgi:dTDP-glucose 4,6-dehydratase